MPILRDAPWSAAGGLDRTSSSRTLRARRCRKAGWGRSGWPARAWPRGYWSRPEETARRSGAAPGRRRPCLRTGDLGFLQTGELFVTGRLKDLIILRGRNHYPQDVELTVEQSHPALRPGCGAAFAVEEGGEERLVVVQELRREARHADPAEVLDAIRRAVAEEHEVQLHAVVLLRTASLPKTSSGKVRRHACREGFLHHTLAAVAAWEAEGPGTGIHEIMPAEDLSSAAGAGAWLAAEAAARAGVARSAVTPSEPLNRLALDSINVMELAHAVEERLGAPVPMEMFLDGASAADVVARAFAARAAAEARTADPGADYGVPGERPLSYGQRALWLLYLLEPASAAYNVPGLVTIEGEVDAGALRRAFQAIVDRHPVLRSTYTSNRGEPVRRISDRVEAQFFEESMARSTEESFARRLDEEANRPFDLEAETPLRVHLFSRSKQEHVLLVVMHHIATDFWSQGVMLQELDALYPAARTGEEGSALPPAVPYHELVRWQRDLLAGEAGERMAAYWRGRLAGGLPALELPTDRPRPPVQTYAGATRRVRLGGDLLARLASLGHGHGATLFMTLLAAFQVLLYRYTAQRDLLVGVPTTGRGRAGFAGTVGYFVNPVVLRSDLRGNPPFVELLAQVRGHALGAFEHQDYPFPLLVEDLQPERDASRSPVFQVMFALQKAPRFKGQDLTPFALNEGGARLTVGGLPLVSMPLEERVAQFDLTLTMGESDGELAAGFNYNTGLFDAETIERMALHFENLLGGIAAEPGRRIGDLPLLTGAEHYRMLVKWNHTRAYFPETALIHGLFEAQADHAQSLPAVVFRGEELAYRELDRRANRLAHQLIARGIGPEDLVALCVERSPELIVAILGVLKAGAAYLPLDPEYPRERLAFMVQDAGARLVLTGESLAPLLEGGPEGEDGRPPMRGAAGNAACVIYTSGSTGQPKGVVLTHRNLVNLVVSFIRSYSPDVRDRLLPLTSIASASFVGEIFPILCADGALVLPEPEEILDTGRLIGLIAGSQRVHPVVRAVADRHPERHEGRASPPAADPRRRRGVDGGRRRPHPGVGDHRQRLRPDRDQRLLDLLPGGPGRPPVRRAAADRPAVDEPPALRPGLRAEPHADRLHREALHSGRGGGPRLPRQPRADRPPLRARSVRAGRADVPHGRPRELAAGRQRAVPRPDRPAGQGAGLPRRAGGDRGGARPAHRSGGSRGGAAPGGGGEAAGGLRGGRSRCFLDGRRAARRAARTAAGVHGACGLRVPGRPAAVAQRQGGPPGVAGSRAGAARAGGGLRGAARASSNGSSPPSGRRRSRSKRSASTTTSSTWAATRCCSPGCTPASRRRSTARFRSSSCSRTPRSARWRRRCQRGPRGTRPRPPWLQGLQGPRRGRTPGSHNARRLPSSAWPAGSRARRTSTSSGENLRQGREAIHFFSDEELLAAGVDPGLVANPDYVKAKGILGNVDQFDAGLFGLSPREAELMDPQHRLFLECSWEALERAGYDSGRPFGRVGVFGGASMNTYLITNLISHLELVASADTLQASLGNDKDPLTSRVSYKLNLKGPSITVQTASSTSLVAVHVACQSLLNRDCDMALAGGVSIHLPEVSGYMFHEGGTTSPDGHCRTFDARAKGFVSGHGCGVVVLKRLADALRDGDHVHAVIKGSACNNDGSLKVSYTAPSVDGQVEVYSRRLRQRRGVARDALLRRVPRHGTPMGDPIEIAALTQAFRAHTGRRGFCAIGSLKTQHRPSRLGGRRLPA